jgi:hypothetical protein
LPLYRAGAGKIKTKMHICKRTVNAGLHLPQIGGLERLKADLLLTIRPRYTLIRNHEWFMERSGIEQRGQRLLREKIPSRAACKQKRGKTDGKIE